MNRYFLAIAMPIAFLSQPLSASADPVPFRLDVGSGFACAITADGRTQCWGENQYGQLGTGEVSLTEPVVTVDALAGAMDVTAGKFHTCAVASDQLVRCWGTDVKGAAGGDNGPVYTPTAVTGVADAKHVKTNDQHTCAIVGAENKVRCWGNGMDGQLGDGSSWVTTPNSVEVLGVTGATLLAASNRHTCAATEAGPIYCWGAGDNGRLGDGEELDSPLAVEVQGVSHVVSMDNDAGGTCAVTEEGEVWCWGRMELITHLAPYQVVQPGPAAAITRGNQFTCALLVSGEVWCWGRNNLGQLGDGTHAYSATPRHVLDLEDIVSIDAGYEHACAADEYGDVFCWGNTGRTATATDESSCEARAAQFSELELEPGTVFHSDFDTLHCIADPAP